MAKTVEDFLRLPEGTLTELIDRKILLPPALRKQHQQAARRVFEKP